MQREKNVKRAESLARLRVSRLMAAGAVLAFAAASAPNAMAVGLSAAQVESNCNQISNAATAAAQAKNAQDVARAAAVNSQIEAGQACMQNIENAIHAAIPAIPGTDMSLAGFLASIGTQLMNQVCNIAVGKVNAAGQLINAPIASVVSQVNGSVSGAVNGTANGAVPGVSVSAPNVVTQPLSQGSQGFWAGIAAKMFGN